MRVLDCKVGVHVGPDANRAYVRDVVGTYSASGYPLGSATVWVQGSHALVKDVKVTNTSNGPNSIVLVGYGNTSTLDSVTINNIDCSEKSTPVKIIADDSTIVNVIVDNVSWYSTAKCGDIDAWWRLKHPILPVSGTSS